MAIFNVEHNRVEGSTRATVREGDQTKMSVGMTKKSNLVALASRGSATCTGKSRRATTAYDTLLAATQSARIKICVPAVLC
jgi:hypothetical protein